jgi:hypothetical protein
LITYIVPGPFPDVWKDLISEDELHPNITITSNGDLLFTFEQKEGIKEPFRILNNDGWHDYFIPSKEINEETAKIIAAKSNNTTPDQIIFLYSEIPVNYRNEQNKIPNINEEFDENNKRSLDIFNNIEITEDIINNKMISHE